MQQQTCSRWNKIVGLTSLVLYNLCRPVLKVSSRREFYKTFPKFGQNFVHICRVKKTKQNNLRPTECLCHFKLHRAHARHCSCDWKKQQPESERGTNVINYHFSDLFEFLRFSVSAADYLCSPSNRIPMSRLLAVLEMQRGRRLWLRSAAWFASADGILGEPRTCQEVFDNRFHSKESTNPLTRQPTDRPTDHIFAEVVLPDWNILKRWTDSFSSDKTEQLIRRYSFSLLNDGISYDLQIDIHGCNPFEFWTSPSPTYVTWPWTLCTLLSLRVMQVQWNLNHPAPVIQKKNYWLSSVKTIKKNSQMLE